MSDWLSSANQAPGKLSQALINVHDTAFICQKMAKDLFGDKVTPELVVKLTELAFIEAKRLTKP